MKKKTTVEQIKQIINPPSALAESKGTKGEKMKSDLNYIKKLIKLLNSNDVSEIEVEEGGVKVRVVKNRAASSDHPHVISFNPPVQTGSASSQDVSKESAAKAESKSESKSGTKSALVEVRSPIVGTFYLAPSPNADPYVQGGQTVGKIVEINVENGKPVEYNQLLFRIEPT